LTVDLFLAELATGLRTYRGVRARSRLRGAKQRRWRSQIRAGCYFALLRQRGELHRPSKWRRHTQRHFAHGH